MCYIAQQTANGHIIIVAKDDTMKKPNVVVITTDQQRVDMVGAYGSTPHAVKVKTDHLDRTAAESVRFENTFTCCPLCSPAGTSFLTGTYPYTHKTMTATDLYPSDNQIQPGDDIVINGLKEEGYNTAYVSKRHINNNINPDQFGYDYFVGLGDDDRYRATLETPAAPRMSIMPQSKAMIPLTWSVVAPPTLPRLLPTISSSSQKKGCLSLYTAN